MTSPSPTSKGGDRGFSKATTGIRPRSPTSRTSWVWAGGQRHPLREASRISRSASCKASEPEHGVTMFNLTDIGGRHATFNNFPYISLTKIHK